MLVATTVIEVGVDVPNATVMAILDADRFGIAQLHQLRGRVGRGEHASTCWLITQQREDGDEGNPRVEALVETTDGFALAEVDLELRGEGTLMSTSQKGRSDLKLASLRRDRNLVEMARRAAFVIVDADPDLVNHPLIADEARPDVQRSRRGVPHQELMGRRRQSRRRGLKLRLGADPARQADISGATRGGAIDTVEGDGAER